MKKMQITFFLIMSLQISNTANAHHAMEFIEMESYSTTKAHEFVFHWHFDYMTDDRNDVQADHWEMTPGLSYGLLDRLMIDAHCHYAKFGNTHIDEEYAQNNPEDPVIKSGAGMPAFVEAAAFALQFRVTDYGQLPIDIAVSPFYEIPTNRAKKYLGSEQVYGGSLILGRNFGLHNNITANFSWEREGDENSWGWGLGIKFTLSMLDEHAPAFGVEVLGDYKGHTGIMPGIYAGINQNTVFKAGIFIGLSQYSGKKNDEDFMEDREEDFRTNITIMTRW